MTGQEDLHALESALTTALTNYARAVQDVPESELVTHFVTVIATQDMDSGYGDTYVLSSQGHNGGLPPWQAKGLLQDGLDQASFVSIVDADEQDD